MATADQQVDVTVMGAGIFGLSVAWAAARRGAKVRVIDPNGIGAGASGGIVGALAPHVPEQWNPKKAFQLDSLLMADDWWAEVARVGGGDPGYARTGRLQPLTDEAQVARAQERAENAETLWQGRAVWEVVSAGSQGDWAPHSPSGWLVHDTLTGRIHPRQALAALAAALRNRNAEITEEGPEAGKVVWATGVHDLTAMQVPGAGVKGQAALFRLEAANRPQLFAEALHIVPHADGTVAVGSTSERDWENANTTDALLEDVIAQACAVLPALSHAPIIERWAGLRPRSKSRAPVLGAHPARPGQFIANGGFKIGFGMAPLVGEVMADLILEGRDRIPDPFRA